MGDHGVSARKGLFSFVLERLFSQMSFILTAAASWGQKNKCTLETFFFHFLRKADTLFRWL